MHSLSKLRNSIRRKDNKYQTGILQEVYNNENHKNDPIFLEKLIKINILLSFFNRIEEIYNYFLVFDQFIKEKKYEKLENDQQWVVKQNKIINEKLKLEKTIFAALRLNPTENFTKINKKIDNQKYIIFWKNFGNLENKIGKIEEQNWKYLLITVDLDIFDNFITKEWKQIINKLLVYFEILKLIKENFKPITLSKYKERNQYVELCQELMDNESIISNELIIIQSFLNKSIILPNLISDYENNLYKSINILKKYLNKDQEPDIILEEYCVAVDSKNQEFSVDSLEWKILRIWISVESLYDKFKTIISESSVISIKLNIECNNEGEKLKAEYGKLVKEIELDYNRECEQLEIDKNLAIKVNNEKIAAVMTVSEKPENHQFGTLEKNEDEDNRNLVKILNEQMSEKVVYFENKSKELNDKKNTKLIQEQDLLKEKLGQLEIDKAKKIIFNIKNMTNFNCQINEFIEYFVSSLKSFILWFEENKNYQSVLNNKDQEDKSKEFYKSKVDEVFLKIESNYKKLEDQLDNIFKQEPQPEINKAGEGKAIENKNNCKLTQEIDNGEVNLISISSDLSSSILISKEQKETKENQQELQLHG